MTQAQKDPMRELIPKPIERVGLPTLTTWLFALLCVVGALMLPLTTALADGTLKLPVAAVEGISLVVLAAVAAGIISSCRAGRGTIPLLLIICLLLTGAGQSLFPAALTMGILFTVGFGGLLTAVSTKKTLCVLPLIPIAAYALAVVICRDPLPALTVLIPFPAAAALGLATRSAAGKADGPDRVGVICAASLALGVGLTAVAAALLYRAQGALSVGSLKALLEQLRTSLAGLLGDAIGMFNERAGKALLEVDPDTLMNTAVGIVNLIPAAVVILCNVTAALSQMLLHAALAGYGFGDSVRGRVRVFRMSLVSCIVFLIAYIVALTAVGAGNTTTLAGTVAENVALILQPGLALCGFIRLLIRLTGGGKRPGCAFFLLFLLVFILPYVFVFMPFYESIAAIIGAIAGRLRAGRSDNDGTPGNGPSGNDGEDE